MDGINWSDQISQPNEKITIIAEYLLNNTGVFMKKEQRISREKRFTFFSSIRLGFTPKPNEDYVAAPGGRNAFLWYKVTGVEELGPDSIRIYGNKNDSVTLTYPADMRDEILIYIKNMLDKNPMKIEADMDAADWISWRDDDHWEDPFASLKDMLISEQGCERFLEEDVMEETILSKDRPRQIKAEFPEGR